MKYYDKKKLFFKLIKEFKELKVIIPFLQKINDDEAKKEFL